MDYEEEHRCARKWKIEDKKITLNGEIQIFAFTCGDAQKSERFAIKWHGQIMRTTETLPDAMEQAEKLWAVAFNY